MTALRVEGARLRYPGARTPAVDGVTLALAPGTFTALVGKNGSGKSSLLTLLGGIRRPDAGEARAGDARLGDLPRDRLARQVAFLPARAAAPPDCTGLEVVLMGRHPFGRGLLLERDEDVRLAEAALARAGALPFRDRLAGALSGGERQRVLVARALCQGTPALLLDEPTSAQDPARALDLFALFAALAREGRTVVVATHDLNAAARFADRLVALEAGRVVADGPPSAVLAPAPLRDVFDVEAVLGTDGAVPFAVPRRRAGRPVEGA
ncbi:MAG: ABC transporter ATP-binding protein [Planctomycetes bacterium]|nr:ABC transporter ATP-binding protein [Planctomycetota bacterium]